MGARYAPTRTQDPTCTPRALRSHGHVEVARSRLSLPCRSGRRQPSVHTAPLQRPRAVTAREPASPAFRDSSPSDTTTHTAMQSPASSTLQGIPRSDSPDTSRDDGRGMGRPSPLHSPRPHVSPVLNADDSTAATPRERRPPSRLSPPRRPPPPKVESYGILFRKQDGVCAFCGRAPEPREAFHTCQWREKRYGFTIIVGLGCQECVAESKKCRSGFRGLQEAADVMLSRLRGVPNAE